MTAEEAAVLKPGDIIEFRGESAYWLAKLVKVEKGVWKVTNHGKESVGVTGCTVLDNPEHYALVGHSDYVLNG